MKINATTDEPGQSLSFRWRVKAVRPVHRPVTKEPFVHFDSGSFFDTPLESGKNTWNDQPCSTGDEAYEIHLQELEEATRHKGWTARMRVDHI